MRQSLRSRFLVQPGFARPVERVDGFAVHVELELPRRRVADPHGPAALVAGQMRQLELRQVAFAQRAVEDLEVRRVAADGAQQPVAPRARLVEETGPEQRVEREGGVAQPAVAVIPVAAAAELLGQAGGRRGHDAAARSVGQRLEREQGAPERVAPFPVAAGGAANPLAPPGLRHGDLVRGVERRGRRLVRGKPAQDEGHGLARVHLEPGLAGRFPGGDRDAGAQDQGVGTRDQREFA